MSQVPDRWKAVRKDFIELMKLADTIADDVRGGDGEGFQEPLDFKDRLLIANMMLGLDRIQGVKQAMGEPPMGIATIEQHGTIDRKQTWEEFKQILQREGYKEEEAQRLLGFLVTTPPGQNLLKCMLADSLAHIAQRAAKPTPPQG